MKANEEMDLSQLLEGLNELEDRVPTILGFENEGVQLLLSPDGSGCLEAELKGDGTPKEGVLTKTKSSGQLVARGDFESIDELLAMLSDPTLIEWRRTGN